jgi:hypothetical protein
VIVSIVVPLAILLLSTGLTLALFRHFSKKG